MTILTINQEIHSGTIEFLKLDRTEQAKRSLRKTLRKCYAEGVLLRNNKSTLADTLFQNLPTSI